MATSPTAAPQTLADLLEQLGDISPRRVMLRPAPGTATEHDVIDISVRNKRLCELIDGVLVEKAMRFTESTLAALLTYFLVGFNREHDMGIVAGADGMLGLAPGLVRIPDVSFVSWDRLPGRRIPSEPIPTLVPDLAVEVLSKGNTAREMTRKLDDYFAAGVRLVWCIDPKHRTLDVYTAPDQATVLEERELLTGGTVLPGFLLPLSELFHRTP
ncbi:Uma2 family endonuclease [Singulisphaera rosea]